MGNVLTACSEKHKLLSGWDPHFIPKCRELNPAAPDEMKGISGATIPTASQWQGQDQVATGAKGLFAACFRPWVTMALPCWSAPAHSGGAGRGRAGSEGSVLTPVCAEVGLSSRTSLAQAPLQPFPLAAAVGAPQEPEAKAAVPSGVSLPCFLLLIRAAQACRQIPVVFQTLMQPKAVPRRSCC